jgi:hypothetical protein
MSTIAQRQAEVTRRRSILATLYFATAQTLSTTALRDELERVHGQVASADRVRADLLWLADVGLVQKAGDAATLTERGREIVLDRAVMPGEA